MRSECCSADCIACNECSVDDRCLSAAHRMIHEHRWIGLLPAALCRRNFATVPQQCMSQLAGGCKLLLREVDELRTHLLAGRMIFAPHQRWECGEMSASFPGRQGALQAKQASGCLYSLAKAPYWISTSSIALLGNCMHLLLWLHALHSSPHHRPQPRASPSGSGMWRCPREACSWFQLPPAMNHTHHWLLLSSLCIQDEVSAPVMVL